MADLQIKYIKISELKPWKRNARTHSRKQVKQIAESIKTFGFTNSILVDDGLNILAGHGRLEAAKLTAMTEVPCVRLNTMTDSQKRAYVLADNKLALNAGWDEDLLADELGDLFSLSELEFDPLITGFSIAEVDLLIEQPTPETNSDPADNNFPEGEIEARCAAGDIWQLGPHRLVCGDALGQADVKALMGNDRARMIFTDPPYNVKIDGNVCGTGAIKHREFIMASGEMNKPSFIAFLRRAFTNLINYSLDGSIRFICMDWRHMNEILSAGEDLYTELKNVIVWAKDNGGMGTFYRSRHEMVFAFKHGTEPTHHFF